jgi:anthranilate synthase component 1
MHFPSLDEVKRVAEARTGNVVPIYREVLADLETPVSAFLKVKRGDYSFLLESVEGADRPARYSFIGTEPYRVFRSPKPNDASPDDDPLIEVQRELERFTLVPNPNLPPFHGGAVGYVGYEAVRHFEKLPLAARDPHGLPEVLFQFVDTVLLFDHLKHLIKVVSHVRLDGDVESAYRMAQARIDELVDRLQAGAPTVPADNPAPAAGSAAVRSNMDHEAYVSDVKRIIDYIVAGDVIQTVYSQRFSRETFVHPFNVYRTLRTVNPSPYTYYMEMGDHQIVGTSPELLVLVEDGKVATNPIAGTRRRGATEEEDQALEAELRSDEKEVAEHVMLLDLGRNDIGRVSEPGSVRVTREMDVERFSHVMHLVSEVEGRLRPDLNAFDALRATFPAGTVSGAPKIRAMEIVAELEEDQRGPYAGALGYFGFGGNMETAITIRTIVMKDGLASVQAGGGIVYDSKPDAEFEETVNKAMALFTALDLAEARSRERPAGSRGY